MSITGRCRQVTSRAVIIGLLIMPVNFYWIIIAKEPYHYQSVPISFALLYNVVFIMFVLVGINFLLRKFFRNGALSQGELLTIHLILSFTTTLGGMDMMQILPCVMEHAFSFLPLKTNGAAYSTTIFLNGFLAGMRSCLSLTTMVIRHSTI